MRKYVQHELIGMRIVSRDKIDAAFHKTGDEMDVSGEAIELGNDQGCPGLLGGGNGCRKLGPIGPFAALDFAEFPNQFASVAGSMPEDRLALGVQAEAASALAVGRNAKVRNKLTGHGALRNRQTSVCMLPEPQGS